MSYPEIPGGTYEVQTTVLGPGGKTRATASQEIEILSRFGGLIRSGRVRSRVPRAWWDYPPLRCRTTRGKEPGAGREN